MAEFSQSEAQKRERTLFAAVLLSSPGPLVTGLAAVSSSSSTQLADFIRRSAELVALVASWWVFRYIQRNNELTEERQAQLERWAELSVALAMMSSGIIMGVVAVSRFSDYQVSGNVIAGLIIAVLGLIVNSWFWRRYAVLTREQFNTVTSAQQKLYRAKASVDLVVVIALTTVMVAPEHEITRYVDLFGSIAVAIYLIYSGIRTLNPTESKSVNREIVTYQ